MLCDIGHERRSGHGGRDGRWWGSWRDGGEGIGTRFINAILEELFSNCGDATLQEAGQLCGPSVLASLPEKVGVDDKSRSAWSPRADLVDDIGMAMVRGVNSSLVGTGDVELEATDGGLQVREFIGGKEKGMLHRESQWKKKAAASGTLTEDKRRPMSSTWSPKAAMPCKLVEASRVI